MPTENDQSRTWPQIGEVKLKHSEKPEPNASKTFVSIGRRDRRSADAFARRQGRAIERAEQHDWLNNKGRGKGKGEGKGGGKHTGKKA